MRVLISGASGMIGKALTTSLIKDGHEVVRLVRTRVSGNDIFWDPANGVIDTSHLADVDAVVHLSGRSIGDGRWTSRAKEEILSSRTVSTKFLAEQIAALSPKPRLFLSASAIGYYGDRGEELLIETSSPGTDFLSQVCVAWEKSCEPARQAGIRTVNLRIGVVLSTDGGALPRMFTPMKLGLGGKFGSGKQYWSWITLDDLIGAIRFSLDHDSIIGPVNAVAPNPVTNATFTKVLARHLHRPAILGVPAFALRLLLGEMAGPLLLSSTRVSPDKLTRAGFEFQSPDLEPALRTILSR